MAKMHTLFGEMTPNTDSSGAPLEELPNPETLPEDHPDDLPYSEEETPDEPTPADPGTDEETATSTASTPGEFSYLDTADSLVTEGIFIPDPDKEYEDSAEGFLDVARDTVQALWNQQYGLADEEDRAYLAFRKQGGTNQQWLDETTPAYGNLDVTHEETARAVLTAQYTHQGFKADQITKKLDRLEKNGDLEDEAKEADEYMADLDTKKSQAFQEEILQRETTQKQAQKDHLVTLNHDIDGLDQLAGIPLSPALKQGLYGHITKPVGPRGETQYQLNQGDKTKALSVALLDFLGIDNQDLERKATTKATNDLQKTLATYGKSDKTGKGQNVQTTTPQGNKIPTKGMPWSK